MTPVQAIVARELRTAVVSPILYVISAVFLLSFGVLYYVLIQITSGFALSQMQIQGAQPQFNLNQVVFRSAFYLTVYILMILLPILTMRTLSEERKLRTFELLATSPVHMIEIVMGKFLSVFLLYLGLLALTLPAPAILYLFNTFHWDPIFTAYAGLALLGAFFLSTGILTSSLTENQIVAALLSFAILFLLWLVGLAGTNLSDTTFGQILSYISFNTHFEAFVLGLVDTKDVVYFLSATVLMLFLTHRVLESQRWL